MENYNDLLFDILTHGNVRDDRTGTGTLSVFGRQLRFDLTKSFPMLTQKKLFWKNVSVETAWFLRGDSKIKYLNDHNVTIWDAWADENGDLGPTYGHQWRNFDGVDQIRKVYDSIRLDPYSRRHVVSAWNVSKLPEMRLEPCHILFQFYVRGNYLDLHLYMRSVDTFVGLPYNIAEYALICHIMAKWTNLTPGELVISTGDTHIYANHISDVKGYLARPRVEKLPQLMLAELNPLHFEPSDAYLVDYEPLSYMRVKIAV